ncbi:MAG TPA: hypothetical protein VGI79_12565 [Caulobacteraceae bacterium]|jgi:hypothetical protein
MINWLNNAGPAQFGSAALVVAMGAIVGHHAALGMNAVQWAGAAAAILGSVMVAVLVHMGSNKPV